MEDEFVSLEVLVGLSGMEGRDILEGEVKVLESIQYCVKIFHPTGTLIGLLREMNKNTNKEESKEDNKDDEKEEKEVGEIEEEEIWEEMRVNHLSLLIKVGSSHLLFLHPPLIISLGSICQNNMQRGLNYISTKFKGSEERERVGSEITAQVREFLSQIEFVESELDGREIKTILKKVKRHSLWNNK